MPRALTSIKLPTTIANMGTRAVERGPAAGRVAANVEAWRRHRRLSLEALSLRMSDVGRPVLASGLSKIEQGERRVDVDDLVALALALEVTPTRLLLPPEADGEPVQLTGAVSAPASMAWRWAAGDAAAPDMWGASGRGWAGRDDAAAIVRRATSGRPDLENLLLDDLAARWQKHSPSDALAFLEKLAAARGSAPTGGGGG